MKSVKKILMCFVLLFASITVYVGCDDQEDPLLAQAKNLVSQMTLEEKVNIVVGAGMDLAALGMSADPINLIKDVNGVAGYINGNERLDIPAVKVADGPAGLRIDPARDGDTNTYYCTAFPIATMLASTWNEDLLENVGKAVGEEIKEYGVDMWLAPALNIQRNPLCGRNFEYYSEDPLVTGKTAASIVKGVESENIGTTIKHFAANNSETNRMSLDTIMTERAMREIYLKCFQIAVEEAQPWAVMSSYNKINGTYTSQSKELLTDILRNEWGFNGFVMTDWFAGDNSAEQMKAGNDLIMPGVSITPGYDPKETILNALISGELDESVVHENAVRIIAQALKSSSYNQYDYSETPDLESHAKISREAATEGMVLLENDGTLPITSSKRIASFGVGQIMTYKGGTGSGDVHPSYTISIIDGLKETYQVDQDLYEDYESYVDENAYDVNVFFTTVRVCEENPLTEEQVSAYVNNNDVAVITISRFSGEGSDRTNTAGDYLLTDREMTLINNVSAVFHSHGKKVAVILNIGGPIEMASWKDKVDAVLLAWQPGQESGYAVADVLSGKVNPSGKLAQTIPVSYSDNPSAATFPGVDSDGDGTVDKIYYNDDIYVGYRYYSTFNVKPQYEFGYGLSYTSFEYSHVKISSNKKGKISLSVYVRNSGDTDGKEVVQVYVSAPDGKLSKPKIELKSFSKTRLLHPGQSQKLNFDLDAKVLASFDAKNNEWVVEPGLYKVYVSASSDVSNVKPVKFLIKHRIIVSKTTPDALALSEEIENIIIR